MRRHTAILALAERRRHYALVQKAGCRILKLRMLSGRKSEVVASVSDPVPDSLGEDILT